MQVLQKDGIIYIPYEYKNELELQRLIEDNFERIFGEDAVYLPGQRIGVPRGERGAKGIPDGFLLLLDRQEWIVVEVELSSHPVYDHIIPQVSKFTQAWKKGDSQKRLVEAFFKQSKESPHIAVKFERLGFGDEIHRFITNILYKDPRIIIIMDKVTPDVIEAVSALSYTTQCIEFKTYQREGVTELVPIFQYEQLHQVEPLPAPSKLPDGKSLVFLDKKVPFTYSKEIPVIVANELIRMGKLTEDKIPWGPGKIRYLVSKEPRHPSGKDFFAPVQLDNGWWVETHAGTESNVSYASRLLKMCGVRNSDVRID